MDNIVADEYNKHTLFIKNTKNGKYYPRDYTFKRKIAKLLLKMKFMKFKKIIITALIIVIICVAGIYIYENMKPLTINDYFEIGY